MTAAAFAVVSSLLVSGASVVCAAVVVSVFAGEEQAQTKDDARSTAVKICFIIMMFPPSYLF